MTVKVASKNPAPKKCLACEKQKKKILESDQDKCFVNIVIASVSLFLFVLIIAFLFLGCTISFTSVSTQGKADDIVDEQQTPQMSSSLILPTTMIPG